MIICTDLFEGYCMVGETIEEAYDEYCAFHGNIDIEKLKFFDATLLPKQTGLDYE